MKSKYIIPIVTILAATAVYAQSSFDKLVNKFEKGNLYSAKQENGLDTLKYIMESKKKGNDELRGEISSNMYLGKRLAFGDSTVTSDSLIAIDKDGTMRFFNQYIVSEEGPDGKPISTADSTEISPSSGLVKKVKELSN